MFSGAVRVFVLAALWCSFVTGDKAQAGEVCFSTASLLKAGAEPVAVCALDIGNDGLIDYAIANYAGHTITVNRKVANGGFLDPVSYLAGYGNLGYGPTSIAAAEFTGDGIVDLVFTSGLGNAIGFMRGNANGTFATAVFSYVGLSPQALACADLDGDGDLDVVTADANSSGVSVMLNDGNGGFDFSASYQAGLTPRGVLAVDFDGDDDLDVAVVCRKSKDVAVFFNDGSGTLGGRVRFNVGTEPTGIASGDFDEDSDFDIAVAVSAEGVIKTYTNDGSGAFSWHNNFAAGDGPYSVAGGDFDADGELDLATTNFGSQELTVLLGRGDNFASAKTYRIGDYAASLCVVDADADGDDDVALPMLEGGTVLININQGGGYFPEVMMGPAGEYVWDMEVADIDGNGMMDIVSVNAREATVSVTFFGYYGRPDHTYHYPTGADPWDAFVADTDGDGDLDVLVSCFSAQRLQVLENDGSGYLAVATEVELPGEPTSVSGADFDDDGDVDAVIRIAGNISSAQGLFILTNDGARHFALRHDVVLDIEPDYALSHCGDFDSDGRSDVVVRDRSKIRIAFNRGALQFEMLDLLNVSTPYVEFDTDDIDGDGDLDIAAIDFSTGRQLTILKNDGSGTFSQSFFSDLPTWCDWPQLADLNADGRADLVLSGIPTPGLAIALGNGESFDAAQEYFFQTSFFLQSADLDSDGDLDLITSQDYTGRFMVRLNCLDPSYAFGDCNEDGVVNIADAVFLVNYIFAGGPAPVPRLRGDINRDGIVNVSDAVRILRYLFFGEALK